MNQFIYLNKKGEELIHVSKHMFFRHSNFSEFQETVKEMWESMCEQRLCIRQYHTLYAMSPNPNFNSYKTLFYLNMKIVVRRYI